VSDTGAGASGDVDLGASLKVKQRSRYYCWAAALESWLNVDGDRPYQTQYELVGKYGMKTNAATYGHLDLSSPEYCKLLDEVRLDDTAMMECKELTVDRVTRTLRDKGRFLILYRNPGAFGAARTSHVIVVYGVKHDRNRGPTLLVMDPGTGIHTKVSLARFQQREICKLLFALGFGTTIWPPGPCVRAVDT
jgi:Papain-like cysteine protease AvrRpt2